MTALMPEPVSVRGGSWPGSKPPTTGSWAGGTASVSSPDQGREARAGEAGRGCLRGSRPAAPLGSAGRGVGRAAPGTWGTRGSDLTTVLCASRVRRPDGRCLQESTSNGGAAQAHAPPALGRAGRGGSRGPELSPRSDHTKREISEGSLDGGAGCGLIRGWGPFLPGPGSLLCQPPTTLGLSLLPGWPPSQVRVLC